MKQRRIGTLTLGIGLIMIGILVPLSLIFKDMALRLVQFSPLILIVLGAEVLYYAFRYKEEKLRYDGLSIFLVIAITVSTIAASTFVPFIDKGISYYRDYETGNRKAYNMIEDAMVQADINGGINLYSENDFFFYWASDNEERTIMYRANINLHDEKEVAEEAVVNAVYEFTRGINTKESNVEEISFYWEHLKGRYDIRLRNDIMKDITKEDIAKKIRKTTYEKPAGNDIYTESEITDQGSINSDSEEVADVIE